MQAQAKSDHTDQLLLTVVTPARKILEAYALWVTVPGSEGEMGILPEHAPLLTTIHSGIITYQDPKSGESHSLAVHDGYAQVDGKGVTVLSQMAESKDEIDLDRAREAEKKASHELAQLQSDKGPTAKESKVRQLEDRIRRAQTRQSLAG